MDWLEKISITCFTASYLVVLALEISRTIFFAKWFKWIAFSVTLAGVFAHIVYLGLHQELVIDRNGLLLSGWTGWFLVASLVTIVIYLALLLRHGDSIVSLYLVPLAIVAIAIGNWPGQHNEFSMRESRSIWNTIHGLSFLFSTVVIGMGFLFGLMYLIQSWRLKNGKVLRIRMPSLEWLQSFGEKTLWSSAALLSIGVVSGVAINIANRSQGTGVLPWFDPVVLTSSILLFWLLGAIAFNWFFRSTRPGRKISYLVMSCFLFLVLEIGLVLYSGHATEVVDSDRSVAHPTIQQEQS